jgi:hypothetical protein
MTINWKAPAPRSGLAGALDRFVGPGATSAEPALQFVFPIFATIAASLYASRAAESWTWLQHVACCALAFDTVGGVLVVSWLYLAFDVAWFVTAGGYLLCSAAVELSVPQYLQRPVALAVYACALLISIYVLRQLVGLEWFLPLFYLKLLVSHLPKEEPYRPSQDS